MPLGMRTKAISDGPSQAEFKLKMKLIITEHRMELKRILEELSGARDLAIKLENDKHRQDRQKPLHASTQRIAVKVMKLCPKCPSQDFTALLKQMHAGRQEHAPVVKQKTKKCKLLKASKKTKYGATLEEPEGAIHIQALMAEDEPAEKSEDKEIQEETD